MDVFSVTAPLTLRYPDETKKLVIKIFKHQQGIIVFEPFWHIDGLENAVHLIKGHLKGNGPWKVGDCVISVTGCHTTDQEMSERLAQWQAYLATPDVRYPHDDELCSLALKLGAIINEV